MYQEEAEQSLVLIKPDALKNSLTGFLLSQLSEFHTGSRFAASKIVQVSRMLAEQHYSEHREKSFYPALIDYIMGCAHYPNEVWKRRVIAIVYYGQNVMQKIRDVVGPTNPHIAREKNPGCIRTLGTVVPIKDEKQQVISERLDNLIHASANLADADREIKLWFKPNDIPPLMHAYPTDQSKEFYYFKENKLYRKHEPGCVCILAPADVAWKSDLETLRKLSKGIQTSSSLESVVAKYLINEKQAENW